MALDYDALRKKHKKRDEENWAKEKASKKQNSFETTQENKNSNKGSYNEKTKVSSSRVGIESERNTVDASVSDRAAARKAAAKKNTQQKITQPGNSNELSGSSRSKDKIKINNTVNDEKKTVTTPAAGLPAINRADNIKEDAEISSIVNRAKGLSDEERKSFLVEEARKRSKSTSNADIVMKQLKRQDAGAWEQEKAEYNYRKENGLLEKNDAKTQHYIDRFYSMSEDERQLVANIYADIEVNHGHKDLKAKNKYTSAVNKLKFEYGYTDEDIEAMRYFYGRYINKKNAKTDDINARLAMDKHPVLESIASIPTGIAGGVMAAGGILDSYIDNKAVEKIGIQDQGIDYNHEFSKMQRQAQSGRDQFTKTHDFMIGGYDVGDLLYNTALSGVESATAAMIPGGAALLAVNAGTSKVNELSQRGLSSNKAIAGGLAAAATEMIFESVSIGNFKKMQEVEPNTIMDVVANVAKSMGVNASEEALTEAANIVYDTVMHGDKSDYQMQVEYLVNEKGMTREAAEKKARTGLLGQVGEAALSGAIMGVGFGGVASVPNYIGRSAAIEAMGIQAKKSGMKDEIIAEAKAAPKNSKANKTVNREIKKSEKSGEAISDYKLGLMAVQSNDVALKDTGRFSNVKTEAELEERYQSAIQMKKDKGSDSVKQIQKEYEQAKARIRMQAAAKAEADKFEGAQKTERKANELTRIEITNPTIEVDGKRYSIEGKNFDSKTEEIGDAQTIFKDSDGDNAVRFGDGQTMKVSEAVKKMTDETAKEVYKATEGMSPEAANLFISNYDGDTVPEYKDAFNYYFNMGRAGLTAEDIRKDNELYGSYFTAEAQRQIATAGLKSREFKAGVTELTLSRSTKPYKQTVQLIDQWAKESGLEVIILKDSDKVNGYHLQGTNRIVLYNEVDGKENILTRTFGHETFHFISENSSAEAEKLRRYVIEALEKNGVDIEKALQKYADITDGEGNNVYSTRESQIDELVADSMFDVFTNKAAIERLAKNDRTLAQKIYDKFKDILNIIKSKLKLFDTMNNNPEIRALMNDADSLEQIVNKFHDALDVAKNNYNVHDSGKDAGNGQKNNADGTAKNFSIKNVVDNNGKEYPNTVVLDTKIFKGIKPRNWSKTLINYFYNNMAGKKITTYDDVGNEKTFEIARYNERAKKDGAKNPHRVVDKLAIKKNLNSQLAVVHAEEIIQVMNYVPPVDEIKRDHQWLDSNGWEHYKAYLMQNNGKIFESTINVAKTKDGRNILYDINKIKEIGHGTVSSKSMKAQRDLHISPDSKEILLQNDNSVKHNFSMNSSEKSLDEMKAERSTLQDEYRELKGQIDNLKASAEYIAFEDEIRKVRKNGSLFGGFEAVKEIRRQRDEWADEAGLTELQKRYHDISEQIHDYDLAIYKIEKEQKIKATEETAKKVKAFTHDVVMKYATDAAKKFGITKKFENAGYMLPDGKLLDFSDGQGYRVLDHREIKNVLDFLPDGHNYSDGLIQFMNMGNIRMQIGGIDISRMPSNEQIPVLRKFFKENNGEITVDFSKENGYNAGSVEYPAGTSSDRILNDIKSYFTTGNVPKLTGAAAFHAMYSRNGDSAIDAHYGEVVKENKHWRAIVSMLTDEKFSSIRKDVYLNGSDIHRISKELIKKASSKYDLATFENQLTAIFDYIATSKSHVDTDAVFSAIYQLSNDVLGESEIKDTELYEQYADVRKFLHDVEIYIPDNVRKEINSQFGDFKSFRNQLMGKVMHISTKNTNARSLDEVWQELSEIAPEYFPKDMNELDMPMQLTRFFDSIAPKIVNPYEHYKMNIEEEAAVFATEILESYYKIRVEKTDSGKARDIIKEGMRQLQINRKALQNDFKRKEQENADEYRERIAEYKFQRAEGDRRRRLRNEIERNYNYLNRRFVRETDKDHIPENLKPLVSAFRDIVPDSNSRFSRKALTEFENEYRKLEEVSTFYNEDFANIISDFKDRVTGIDVPRMRDIDGYELDVLRNITEHIKYIVQNENRLFSEGLNGRVEEFGKSVHNELFEKKDSKDQGVPERGAKKTDKIRNGVNSFIKGLTKPEYLFEGIGSPTVKALYDELRKGENIEAKIVYDAKLAEQEIKKRNNYDQRWGTQTVTLDLRSGKRNVTIEDVMALYATSRRKQGLEHMLNGGVVIYSQKDIAKNGNRWVAIKKSVIKDAKKNDEKLTDLEIVERTNNIYNDEFGKTKKTVVREQIVFNEQDISLIEKVLTNDQKNYVNDMVEYITKTIGEKRNEVSMKLYGIEKYKESFYFPIKVDRNFVDTSVGKQEVVSTIKNQSSSKRTVDHARNPIEITGFTDTVNNHVFDSALYCAYVLPINDFKRVYNYREKVYDGDGVESLVPGGVSVKSDIERTSGVNAIKEIERFMISLDSGSRYENLMPFSAKLMARTKKTAVMANLSVVVQQPTAVFRAMLYISPKHFATWANKADIEEMKRWNGCALKKEIGYFDVNMGRSATDYMNEYSTEKSIKEDWSLSDKVKNSNAMLKIDQAAGILASKADEQTWGAIWKACKKQVKAENPGLSGDSLNAAAAELFQSTISKTQVYDSVFTKPEYMRRKEGFAMMATQFMSEPLTSLNMLAESVVKAKNTEKGSQQRKDALKFSARAFGCYITSVVVNSALKGIIYAMRDDDDDETFLEKYISNVAESIVTDPIGMVPYLKDILSIVQGYDLNRADVAVFTTMADAIKDLGSDKKTTFEKIMSVMKAAGQASGIPVYNVMRDAKSIIDIAIKIKEGVENGFPETTGRGVLNELKETFDWLPGIDAESNYEQLYSSIIKGDQKHYDRVYNSLVADGKSMSNIENGIGKVLAEKNSVLAEAFNLILADKSVEASGKIQELKNAGFSNEIINNALSTYKTNLKNDLVENEEKSEDNRIKQAAFARYDMDYTLYESLVDELVADGYNETIVREAIDSEKVELEKAASEFSLNEKDEYTGTYDMRNALQKNNFDNFESVYKKIAENSGESEAKKNAKSEIKKAYKDGHISEGKAGELLKEYVDSDYSDTDVWKELYKAKSSRNSIYDKMYDAIDNGGNFSIDYLLEQGIEKDDIAGQIATYAKPKLLEMEVDSKEYNEMYENILDAYVTVGKTEAYGASRIRKWHSDAAKAERKKNMRK